MALRAETGLRPRRLAAVLLAAALLPAPGPLSRTGAGASSGAASGSFSRATVASADGRASRAGVEILRRGGSAADAAVAVALALAVVHPQAGNLAGGHFSLWRSAGGEVEVIDGREQAPAATGPDLFLDDAGEPSPELARDSSRAIAVPATLPGLRLLHLRHGRRPWPELVEPALRLAAEGFAVSPRLAADLARHRDRLAADPDAAAIFLPGGRPPAEGDILVQEDLAWTLARIRDDGGGAFAAGPLHRRLADDLSRRGAAASGHDLTRVSALLRPPLAGFYRGHRVLVPPPPSAGGIGLLQSLQVLERLPLAGLDADGPEHGRLLAEALRRPFRDRQRWLADPAFATVPVSDLLAPARMATWALEIDSGLPRSPATGLSPARTGETTHFSIVDADGNAVAQTTTLNSSFGAARVARGTGVLWNNGMDDFATAPGVPDQFGIPGSTANAVAPGKRPLSSMTPTMVEKDGTLRYVLGSPGGSSIPSTVIQVLVRLIDHQAGPAAAVAAPRLHHQDVPDLLRHEPRGWPPETLAGWRQSGYSLKPWDSDQGDVHLVAVTPDGRLRAVSDPRRGGAPAGY